MKIVSSGVYEVEYIGNRFRDLFVEHILDTMIKGVLVGFLCIL